MKTETLTADDALVDRIRQGDAGAYNEMVARYWDRIFHRVYQLLKNHEDAEEVTQDAFVRAHRGLENFRGDSSFSTWLFQIATNLAHNRYWYWWRRKREYSFSLDHSIGSDHDLSLADVLAAEEQNPCDESMTKELSTRVADCLPKLSPKHREILEMRIQQNLSYEEIASKLNISVGTVKSRIARARESLKAEMGAEFA